MLLLYFLLIFATIYVHIPSAVTDESVLEAENRKLKQKIADEIRKFEDTRARDIAMAACMNYGATKDSVSAVPRAWGGSSCKVICSTALANPRQSGQPTCIKTLYVRVHPRNSREFDNKSGQVAYQQATDYCDKTGMMYNHINFCCCKYTNPF